MAQTSTSAGQQQLVAADTAFGFRLLQELAHEKTGANIFISPYSIASVLQMVSTGARGQTQQQLQHALGTGGLSSSTW